MKILDLLFLSEETTSGGNVSSGMSSPLLGGNGPSTRTPEIINRFMSMYPNNKDTEYSTSVATLRGNYKKSFKITSLNKDAFLRKVIN